jgi:hypothetical protein
MEEEETEELEKLRRYAQQMKEQAAARIDELDTLRKHQREEAKTNSEKSHLQLTSIANTLGTGFPEFRICTVNILGH